MKRNIGTLALLLILLFAPSLRGRGLGGEASAQVALTLDDCLRMAEENNHKMEASKYQLKASLYDKRSTRALFLPSFTLTGNAIYSTADGSYSSGAGQLPVFGTDGQPNGLTAYFPGIDLAYDLGWIYNGGLKVEQPIYMGGKILASYRMARLVHEIAVQNQRLTDSEVIVETSEAYANVVRTKELVAVANAYHTLLQELMRNVETAHKHGLKPQNDVLKVKVRLNESELNLRRAENGLRLAQMNLCHYIGRPLTETVETEGTLPETTMPDEGDIYNRPEYLMLEKKGQVAKQKVRVALSEHLPQVGFVGQYGYTNGVKLNGSKLLDSWSFLAGIQVSVPIFDFGRRYNSIRSARAQYRQVEAERADTNELLVLEAARAYNNLDEAYLERTLADSSVTSAEENLRTSRLHYEKGVEMLSDYLEAQTLWQQARQTQVEARINCYLCWLEYQKATGRIN